jgi:hypothetical protein
MKRCWLVLLIAVAACNKESPTGPGFTSGKTCAPPTLTPVAATVQPFAPAAMRAALLDAATRMSAALGTGADVQSVQAELNGAAADMGASNYAGACGMVTAAASAVAALPNDAATLPDRDAIRLVLALAAQSLTAAAGQ